MLPLWLIAFAAAVLTTQFLVVTGRIDLADTRFFGTPQSLSGAIIGGVLFGVGMVLTRGCASRLIVLCSSGNLRAIFSIAIIAAVAWATYQGPLVPLRNAVAGLLMTSSIGTNDLAFVAGSNATGPILGTALALIALSVAVRRRLSPLKAVSGAIIGILISGGWYLSYQFSLQVFEPVQADSLSYMRPLANTINFAASGGDASFLSMDVGLIAGTIFGALAASVVAGSFRIRTFGESGTPHWLRYAAGSALMGFGGILAVGCTIGAGFTGGSVLAITSLAALLSMILSAMVADRVLDGDKASQTATRPSAMPAE